MAKISRYKKFWRVFKRKLLKPLLMALIGGVMIYVLISNIILHQKIEQLREPRFVISRITNEFEETEFTYLLLVVQELQDENKELFNELVTFVNKPYPTICPLTLEKKLLNANWNPFAFHIRVKKMFELFEIYERTARLQETISFLNEEITKSNLPAEMVSQINMLRKERENILSNQLSEKERQFIETYSGVIQNLLNQE